MRTYQHDHLWLVFWKGGGVNECKTEEAAKIIASNNEGVFCIRPPKYREL